MCNERFAHFTLPNHFDFSTVTSSCFAEEVVSDNVLSMLYSSPCSLVYGMVPFLNAILGTMLPMLCMAKQDNMKWVFSSGKNLPNVHSSDFDSFKYIYPSQKLLRHDLQLFHSKHIQLWKKEFCQHMTQSLLFSKQSIFLCSVSFPPALCHFSDSILEYLANLDKAPDPTVRKDTFASEIYAAFDILFSNWLQSREAKVRSQYSSADLTERSCISWGSVTRIFKIWIWR